jgi:hypothetical protein
MVPSKRTRRETEDGELYSARRCRQLPQPLRFIGVPGGLSALVVPLSVDSANENKKPVLVSRYEKTRQKGTEKLKQKTSRGHVAIHAKLSDRMATDLTDGEL